MAINRTSPKKGKVVDIPANAPTIGTPTASAAQVSVAFTAPSTATGGPITNYQAISNPDNITATSSTSPVVVTGLTNGTAYTFTVAAGNATGYGPYSSASASATPIDAASFVSIATATPNGSDVTFSSIPSTYKHLQIRAIAKTTRSDASVDSMYLRFNGDTGSNYNVHTLTGNGSSVQASSYPGTTVWGTWDLTDAQSQANTFAVTVIDILDYADTNKYKTTRSLGGSDKNGSGGIGLFSGLWRNTSAITSIRIFAEGNYVSGTSFALYGIKG